ncbi:helix-turn-helix transcriptional regulator [Natronospora cellulosivora (SeqCode)]
MFVAFTAVLDYIENRVTEDISDEEIADIAGFSRSHFRALFREANGQTLVRYIKKRKLSHAAFKLINTDINILDIAVSYGFNSHDSFTRAFRREFGESPSQFRKKKENVSSKIIVPGIYGPFIVNSETSSNKIQEDCSVKNSISNKIFQDKKTLENIDSTVLYGVPAFGEGENTPFVASFRSCLAYLGRHIT